MIWIAPSAKDARTVSFAERLWEAADELRANSGLSSAQYSQPVLGLIFLRFAEVRFAMQRAKLQAAGASTRRGSRLEDPATYHAEGVLYLEPHDRFDFLLNLLENGADTVLVIDAPHIHRQVDCAHRERTPAMIGFIAPGEAVSDEDFKEQLEALNEELEITIAKNVAEILDA